MPSGAKKRKAAKKKKDKGGSSTTNNPSSTATSTDNHAESHGDEHLKHHEGDGAEFSDHHNSELNSTDGEEKEFGKKKEEDSRLEDHKYVDDVSLENGAASEDGGIQIERIMKQNDEFDKKGGSSRSGSNSSSDDESHTVETKVEIADESHPVVDSVKVVDSKKEEHIQVDHCSTVSKFENCAEEVSVLVEKVADDDSDPVIDSVKVVGSNKEEQIQVNLSSPVRKFENCAEEVSALVEKVAEDSGSPAFSSFAEDQKDNGERKSSSFDVNGRLHDTTEDSPPAVKEDLASENDKREVINVAAISDAKEYSAFESEEKVAPSYNSSDYTVKDAEHVKDSNYLGSSDRQPLEASSMRPVQRTSWKGCCGLFELFTGSTA